MKEFRLPSITSASLQGQLDQIKSYLFQLVQQLNFFANETATQYKELSEKIDAASSSVSAHSDTASLKSYLDKQDRKTLLAANANTADTAAQTLADARGYAVDEASKSLEEAKEYADEIRQDAFSYADQKADAALGFAKNYADSQVSKASLAATAYTDETAEQTYADAKSYTDVQAENALFFAKKHANERIVHNYLDNSDFSNPVAQAGQNGTHGSTKYVCDRWISWSADATFANGYITPGSPIDQRLDTNVIDINETYTAAIWLADGSLKVASGKFSSGFGSYTVGVYCPSATTQPYVRINTGLNVKCAALYKGAYTADTIPPYTPKGYAAELAECQRYFLEIFSYNSYPAYKSTTAYAFVQLPVQMRIIPTVYSVSASSYLYGGSTRYASYGTVSGIAMNGNQIRLTFNDADLATKAPNYTGYIWVCPSFELAADL